MNLFPLICFNFVAHAKGILLNGTFTPTAEAKNLSTAPQFNADSTPITVRFSNSTGIPTIPDTDPNANPRGLAVRFNLGGRKHTDLITHSTPFFPVRTGGEFLEFLKALIASPAGTPSPSPVEQFLGSHPKALAFVQAPKPPPSSFSREAYFGVNALKFVNAEGKSTYFRYRVVPDEGVDILDEAAVKEKGPNYLFDDVAERVKKGPFTFKLLAQLAEEGDITDDATVHWPEDRKLAELGSVKVESIVENNDKEQKYIITDPIPRIQGIEPSDDPLLEVRAALYLISGRQRRAAE
jgi:catalase